MIREAGPVNSNNFEEFFIADFEGDLSPEEANHVMEFLKKNPSLKKDYNLFENTFLQQDKNVVYDNKKALKKYPLNPGIKRLLYYSGSIAASIIIILGFYFMFLNNENIEIQNLPVAETITNVKKEIIKIEKADPVVEYNNEDKKLAVANISTHPTQTRKVLQTPVSRYENIDHLNLVDNTTIVESLNSTGIIDQDLTALGKQNLSYAFNYVELVDQIHYTNTRKYHRKRENRLLKMLGFGKVEEAYANIKTKNNEIKGKMLLWSVADIGLEGYNLLTNNDISFIRETDDNGKVVAYALVSDNFEISRNKKN